MLMVSVLKIRLIKLVDPESTTHLEHPTKHVTNISTNLQVPSGSKNKKQRNRTNESMPVCIDPSIDNNIWEFRFIICCAFVGSRKQRMWLARRNIENHSSFQFCSTSFASLSLKLEGAVLTILSHMTHVVESRQFQPDQSRWFCCVCSFASPLSLRFHPTTCILFGRWRGKRQLKKQGLWR